MTQATDPLQNLARLSAQQLRRLLTEHLTRQKLGLYWESSAIERDVALNANVVLPRLSDSDSHGLEKLAGPGTPIRATQTAHGVSRRNGKFASASTVTRLLLPILWKGCEATPWKA